MDLEHPPVDRQPAWQRAWADTTEFAGKLRGILLLVVGGALATASMGVVASRHGHPADPKRHIASTQWPVGVQIGLVVLAAAAGAFLTFVVMQVVEFVGVTPYRQRDEARDEIEASRRADSERAARDIATVTRERDEAVAALAAKTVTQKHADELVAEVRAVTEMVDKDKPVEYSHPILREALLAHFPDFMDRVGKYEAARELRDASMEALEVRFNNAIESQGLDAAPYQPGAVRMVIWWHLRDHAMLKPDSAELTWTHGGPERFGAVFGNGAAVAYDIADADFDAVAAPLARLEKEARFWPETLAVMKADIERSSSATPVFKAAGGLVHAMSFRLATGCRRCEIL